jgi:hypothetical protein
MTTNKRTVSESPKGRQALQKSEAALLGEIRLLIEQTRSQVAHAVNSALVLMSWHIGKRINDQILKNKRAEYGKEIVASLAQQLTADYESGFDRPNLSRMIRLAELFPSGEIVVTLSQQLSWSHFLAIIPVKDHLRRNVPY